MNRPHTEGTRPVRDPSLLDALLPLVTLVVLIGGAILLFGLQALDGPIPAALVVCSMVAMLVAMKNGNTWDAVQEATNRAMESITGAIFILLAVGALIGTWCLSGTIPTLVYYGISVLSPAWYYAASTLICGIIAISIGSSWTTAGTIGVGLIGIAQMLGVSTSVTAGAVISGAYLGDKLSPLSETTIMTAQMVEVDVYEHIKRQAWTSVPAFLIGFILFFIIGLRTPSAVGVDTAVGLKELDQVYKINVG
jgi:NhaC family Na+:H+ antiporter